MCRHVSGQVPKFWICIQTVWPESRLSDQRWNAHAPLIFMPKYIRWSGSKVIVWVTCGIRVLLSLPPINTGRVIVTVVQTKNLATANTSSTWSGKEGTKYSSSQPTKISCPDKQSCCKLGFAMTLALTRLSPCNP